jgi:hypothetical protein
MFDVVVDGGVTMQESSHNRPGEHLESVDTPLGPVGLTICYDLRFPELYRALALHGAVATMVPSNFTVPTGRDHWEVLLRARAIENGQYVVAAATIGDGGGQGGFRAYGRSLVVDPWGTVIACAPTRSASPTPASTPTAWRRCGGRSRRSIICGRTCTGGPRSSLLEAHSSRARSGPRPPVHVLDASYITRTWRRTRAPTRTGSGRAGGTTIASPAATTAMITMAAQNDTMPIENIISTYQKMFQPIRRMAKPMK